MTALPATSDFNGSSVTEGQFKAALSDLRAYLAGLLGSDGLPTSAQVALGAMMASTVVKSAAYTVVSADRGRVLDATGSWTLAMTAAATLGSGFSFSIRNSGTGVITLNPAGSELINNATTVRLAAGQAVFVVCNGTSWFTLGGLGDDNAAFLAITGKSLTQSSTDETAGRLLRVGDFGLGGAVPVIADLNALLPTGIYGTTAATVNLPAEFPHSFGTLTVHRTTATANKQMWHQNYPNNSSTIWVRTYAGGTWGAWSSVVTNGTLIGAVSQTAGVPGGAVIERGSNANGEYTRYADGTQICWHTLISSSGAATSWTFPAVFIAAPRVVGNATATVLAAVCQDIDPMTTSASFSVRDKTDARRADSARLIAIGRWF